MTTIGKYEIHPLAALFPMLDGEDYEKFKNDIRKHGLLEPIITEGNVVIDGRNRLRACEELGIPPRFSSWINTEIANAALTPRQFIWSHNVERRHLSADQRAMLVVQFSEAAEKAKAKERMLCGKPCGESATGSAGTRKELAKQAKVSTHRVRQAQAIAKHAPALLPTVASGETSLKDAEKTVWKTINVPRVVVTEEEAHDAIPPRVEVTTHASEALSPNQTIFRVGFFVKQHGPYTRRRAAEDGARQFAANFVEELDARGLSPLFDRDGDRVEFAYSKDGLLVSRGVKQG